MIRIFYHHPLSLNFRSAQTIQVIRDYRALLEQGIQTTVYGFYEDKDHLLEVEENAGGINTLRLRDNAVNRALLKLWFFLQLIFCNSSQTFVVTRTTKKFSLVSLAKLFRPKLQHLHEMHEESFDYLIKKKTSKDKFLKLIQRPDHILFTNESQKALYESEFGCTPASYVILPNGVEVERFRNALYADNHVLTYLGQFNPWKNVELLFAALSHLDGNFTLRIAGGKSDEASQQYLENLRNKYAIAADRVDYMGYIPNAEVVDRVLNHSNVLLLPLGENIQSQYLTSPMKLFEYMATRIPVVAVDFPSVSLLVSEQEIYLSPCNPAAFANAIMAAVATPEEKLDAMNKASHRFSYTARSKRFSEFLRNQSSSV